MVAWASLEGVNVYDMRVGRRVTYFAIDMASSASPDGADVAEAAEPEFEPERSHCSLLWRDNSVLLVACSRFVKVCTWPYLSKYSLNILFIIMIFFERKLIHLLLS